MKGDECFKRVLEISYAGNLNTDVLIYAEVRECHLP